MSTEKGLRLPFEQVFAMRDSDPELFARMNTLAKDAPTLFPVEKPTFYRHPQFVFNFITNKISTDNGERRLTRMPGGVLKNLVENVNSVQAYDDLIISLWGNNYLNSPEVVRTLSVYITQIRKSLSELGADPKIIETHRQAGYMLRDESIAIKEVELKREMVEEEVYHHPNFELNINQRKLFVNDQETYLSNAEFKLLELLARNENRVVNRNQFENIMGGDDYVLDINSLTVVISRIRKAISPNLKDRVIKPIYRFGYMLVNPEIDNSTTK